MAPADRDLPSTVMIIILVTGMIVTGMCNTLLTKYQDNQCVKSCDDPDPSKREYFEQPVIQTLQMFLGEMGSWLVVGGYALWERYGRRASSTAGYQPVSTTDDAAEQLQQQPHDEPAAAEPDGARVSAQVSPARKSLVKNADDRLPLVGRRVLLLAFPAICDILGTTLMNVGLLFVVASIYQMTRGALVLFVGLFSVVFLRRHLRLVQWLSLVTVVLGVALVGLAGALRKNHTSEQTDADTAGIAVDSELLVVARTVAAAAAATPDAVRTVIGVLLIAGAQIFTAAQFVVEEFILEKYALEPIKVVGWEGIFGFLTTVVAMIVLHLTVGVTSAGRGGYFDAAEGMRQVFENPAIGISSILIMISIGGFNFFGLSVTRSISATSRSLIDTSRTLFVWLVSLLLGWESFKWLQLLGFALMVYGTFLFNGLVQSPTAMCVKRSDRSPPTPPEEMLPEEPIEHV